MHKCISTDIHEFKKKRATRQTLKKLDYQVAALSKSRFQIIMKTQADVMLKKMYIL